MGGGGAGKQWLDCTLSNGTISTGAQPIKGILLEPAADVLLYGAAFITDEAGTQTLECRVYELSGSTQVGAALAVSPTRIGPGSVQTIPFAFAAPVTLSAGHRYVLVCVNKTSGTLRISQGATVSGKDVYRTGYGLGFVTNTNASPANGAAWSVTTASEGYRTAVLVGV